MTSSDKKVVASLYLKGPDLDPQEITKALGVKSTISHMSGVTKKTSSGRGFVTKTGLWGLVVDRDPAEVTDVLEELLTCLRGQNSLVNLPGVQEAYFDVFVACSSDDDGEGACALELNSAQLSTLSHYGIPVRVTVTIGRP